MIDDWPFIPTSEFGEWDFDRVTDFDMQPLYLPAEGLARRCSLDGLDLGSAEDQAAFSLACRGAMESEDITAFVLDRAPRLLNLARALTEVELLVEHMPALIAEARSIAAAIRADVRAYLASDPVDAE